jgi:hypothetical protein
VFSSDADELTDNRSGILSGKALRRAEKIVNLYCGVNVSGIYGSIEIDESDFAPIDAFPIE